MKKIILFILLSLSTISYASAPTRTNNYVSNTTIDPIAVNTNENSLFNYLQAGVDTYANGSIANAAVSSSAAITYSKLNLTGSIVKADLSSSLTPFILPSGAVFFMITGSCPSGTTDVSATYANKFVKINATAGTSSGVVLTATTDAHTLTQSEIPTTVGSFTRYDGNGSGLTGVQGTTNGASASTQSVSNAGGGSGHTHTISTATTLEPSSITMIACQIN